jgi:hypothetical protein
LHVDGTVLFCVKAMSWIREILMSKLWAE